MANSPGRSYREGISLIELTEMFPDEEAAKRWFEEQRWPDGVRCAHCQSDRVSACKNAKPMPYRCKDCRKHFSVRTKSVMAESPLPLRKWVFAIYLCATNLKGVSSLKLHRDLKIAQSSAWFMAHRIREALDSDDGLFTGPVEIDETYIGGKRKNMPNRKRKALAAAGVGRGTVGKAIVAGAKDRGTNEVRARVIENTDKPTLQGFIRDTAAPGATLYTDEHGSYTGMPEYDHEAVNHSVSEYVRGMAHTNGMESFWAMLKRGYQGTFHHFSARHLQLYVNEFATRQGLRSLDTAAMMGEIAARMVGRRLTYKRLVS